MVNYILILIFLHCITAEKYRSEDNDKDFNNCLTWRDDLNAVTLTCRVPNFSIPVTFFHNDTKTEVTCSINKEDSYCTPREKIYDIEHSEETVTIVLEEKKDGRHLDGIWYCTQGKRILTTLVSIFKGIMVDSWVKIQGNYIQEENGTRYIEVVCSSCRKPQGGLTEFAVNGKTEASVLQDHDGKCIHKSVVCSAKLCKCTSTGNMFSLRMQYHVYKNTTEFACEMQFTDELRKGRISQTASMMFKDNAFISKKTIETVVKENEPIPTRLMTTTTKHDTTTRPLTGGNTSKTQPLDKDVNVLKIVVPTVCVCIVVFAAIIFSCIYMKYRKGKLNKGDAGEDRNNPQKIQMCKGCSKNMTEKHAEFMCFDCREYFCLKCRDTVHNSTEELQGHKTIKLKLVPKQFSLSLLNCSTTEHQSAPLKYLCNTHTQFICKHCKLDNHFTCKIERPVDIPSNRFFKMISEYQDALDVAKVNLTSFRNFLERSLKLTALKITFIVQKINLSTQTTFKIEKDLAQETKNNLSKSGVKAEMHETKRLFETNVTQYISATAEHQQQVSVEKLLFDFVLEHGRHHHMMTFAVSGIGKLNTIESALTDRKKQFRIPDISTGLESNTILIKTNTLNESYDNIQSNAVKIAPSVIVNEPSVPHLEDDNQTLKGPGFHTKPTAKISPHDNETSALIHFEKEGESQIQQEETQPLVQSVV